MKVVIVTSDLTYVPNNYDGVINHVVDNASEHVSGVVLVQVSKFSVLAQMPYLFMIGCRGIVDSLAKNLIGSIQGRKSKKLKKQNIPYVLTRDINDKKTLAWLEEMRPDLIINMRTRNIFGDAVLQLPRFGCVNVHHGLLPHQKGLFCDLHALSYGQKTGLTVHSMTSIIDEGNIISQTEIEKEFDYMSYLSEVETKEKVIVTDLIKHLVTKESLPVIELAHSFNSVFTTTPSRKEIREMLRKGMRI